MAANTTAENTQRRLTFATTLAGYAAFLQIYLTQPLLPSLRRIFHASEFKVSLTVSAVTTAVALASPVVGLLADRIGRKRIIVPAIFGLAAATALSATAATLNQLIFWRFLQGLFVPGIIAVTIAYIAEESISGTSGRVTAAYVTGTVAGGLSGRLLGAVAADHLGWQWAFLLPGGLTSICGVMVAIWLPRSRHFLIADRPHVTMGAMLGHLHNRKLLATYFVGFNVLFSLVGLFTYANFLLAGPPFGLSTTALGFVFLVYALGLIVTPASGPFIDRLGHRKALVVATGIVSAGAALSLIHSLVAVIAGLAVLSTGVFICQASASSHAAMVAPTARSAATGLYVFFYYLGGSAGATVLGWAWRLGHWPACVATVLLVQVLAALAAYCFFGPHQSAQRPADEPPPGDTAGPP